MTRRGPLPGERAISPSSAETTTASEPRFREDAPSGLVGGREAFAALERALEAGSPGTLRWTWDEAADRTGAIECLRLLPPAEDREVVTSVLHEQGFRPVSLAAWCRAPGASDWYGVDDTDATLLHVCVQRRLVIGSVDRGWLPLGQGPDDANRATADETLARSLALTLCERALAGDSGAPPSWPATAAGERIALNEAFVALFGHSYATGLSAAVVGRDAAALRRRLLAARPAGSRRERSRERMRRLQCRFVAFNRAGPKWPLLARRDRTGPALVVAVIGSDGSGKSTVSRWLDETLDSAFGARFIYFGTGDGPGSPLRRALGALKRRSRFGTAPSSPAGGGTGNDIATSRSTVDSAPTSLRLIWAVVVAWERIGKMRALERAREAGFVVVTDRYPQNEQAGIHDGPRLGYLIDGNARGPAVAMARAERALYGWFARRVPDRVLLLDVPHEVARRRRPEEPPRELARRIEVARSLRYGDAPRRVIDTAEPLARVKVQALGTVLEALSCEGDPAICERNQRPGDASFL